MENMDVRAEETGVEIEGREEWGLVGGEVEGKGKKRDIGGRKRWGRRGILEGE